MMWKLSQRKSLYLEAVGSTTTSLSTTSTTFWTVSIMDSHMSPIIIQILPLVPCWTQRGNILVVTTSMAPVRRNPHPWSIVCIIVRHHFKSNVGSLIHSHKVAWISIALSHQTIRETRSHCSYPLLRVDLEYNTILRTVRDRSSFRHRMVHTGTSETKVPATIHTRQQPWIDCT